MSEPGCEKRPGSDGNSGSCFVDPLVRNGYDVTVKTEEMGRKPTAYLEIRDGILWQLWEVEERHIRKVNGKHDGIHRSLRKEWVPVPNVRDDRHLPGHTAQPQNQTPTG